MKKNMIKISLVFLGFLFCISTVYAASNTYQNILTWANKQKDDAKQQLKTNLNKNVEEQLVLLNEKANELLDESNSQITAMGNLKNQETTTTINNLLNTHKENLNTVSKEMKASSKKEFSIITDKVNEHTNELVKSFETNYKTDLGNLTSNHIDEDTLIKQKEQANQKLEEEIEETLFTIEQLEEMNEAETNEIVKEYIQRKINFLGDLIHLLNEGHSKSK